MANEETIEGGTLTTLSPRELEAQLGEDAVVIVDVRTPQEYAFQHIEGALLLPLAELEARRVPECDKPVVFYCGSGVRSKKAATMCLKAGWKATHHLGGGFGAWREAGLSYRGVDPMTGAPKTVG